VKHYDVIITDRAYEDMDGIYTYIAETLLEPVAAANTYDKIADAILSLDIMPDRIKIMDSEPAHSQGLRPLLVGNYTAFYVIEEDKVFVVRVIYSSSDISKRLTDD